MKKTIIILALILSYNTAHAAWVAPLTAPPACTVGTPGCDAPINVSENSQSKTGTLQIGDVVYGKKNITFGTDTTAAGTAGKINLWGGLYGFGISSGSLNYVSANRHVFYQGTVPVLSIGSTNKGTVPNTNVGVGTSTPTQPLHVLGRIFSAGETTADTGDVCIDSNKNGIYDSGDRCVGSLLTLPTGLMYQTLRNNGSAWVSSSLLTNTGVSVGVGTAVPDANATLHIVKTANNTNPIKIEGLQEIGYGQGNFIVVDEGGYLKLKKATTTL